MLSLTPFFEKWRYPNLVSTKRGRPLRHHSESHVQGIHDATFQILALANGKNDDEIIEQLIKLT